MNGLFRALMRVVFSGLAAVVLFYPCSAQSAGKEKNPPVTEYWMSVSTQNMSIPGMSEGMSGLGGALEKMRGGPAFGPSRTLTLQLNSPRPLPADPQATHDIPPGQNMGETLPLMLPDHEKVKPEKHEHAETHEKFDKPKARMLIYWGCSDEVRKGQPRVLDTGKMSPVEFGKAMASLSSRAPSSQHPPAEKAGWLYADWPNRKSTIQVPKDGSLQGSHFVHGNYTPDIKFSIGGMHDFMAPVQFASMKGGLSESIRFGWKTIPTAAGYFAMAMAHNEKTGETIFWSSSEAPETGFGLMDYQSNSDVQKFIREKVVMDPKTTSCTIPQGIFKDTGGGMLQFIAYGEELNLVHPPKPKDPKQAWNPIWAAKVRLKSTGMTPLGGGDERKARRSETKERERAQEEEYRQEESREEQDVCRQDESCSGPEEQRAEEKPKESPGPMKKLKGLFGF